MTQAVTTSKVAAKIQPQLATTKSQIHGSVAPIVAAIKSDEARIANLEFMTPQDEENQLAEFNTIAIIALGDGHSTGTITVTCQTVLITTTETIQITVIHEIPACKTMSMLKGGSSAPAFFNGRPSRQGPLPGHLQPSCRRVQRRLDEVMSRGEARGRAAAIDWIDPIPGKRILDLACGPGTLSYPLAKAVSPGGAVVGIDLAPGMIELARRDAPPGLPLTFELMDIEDLRFRDHSFDAAVCGHGLQFVPNLGRALVETRRVLKPGAPMAASVPVDPPKPSDAQAILERSIGGAMPPVPKARDQFATRRIVEDEDSFAAIAKQAGFSAAEAVRYEESTTWASPQHFIDMSAGWWSMAIRLERLSPGERASLLERAARAIEAELGAGPLKIAGATNLLRAIA